jgi:hypothetical protein
LYFTTFRTQAAVAKLASTLALLGTLSACVSTPALPPEDPRQAALIEQECAIYFAAETQIQSTGGGVPAGMSEGCPETAKARTANIAAIEPPYQFTTSYAEILYKRMIARGMPKDVALQVSKSEAFRTLVEANDAVYGKN